MYHIKNEESEKMNNVLTPKVKTVCRSIISTYKTIHMKTKELDYLKDILNPHTDAGQVNSVCRSILCERLQDEKFLERNLRFLIENLVNNMEFQLRYETIEVEKEKKGTSKLFNKTILIYVVIVAIGLYMTSLNGISSIVGGLIALGAGVMIGMDMKNTPEATKETDLIVTTTAEELMTQIDKTYKAVSSLIDYRQIEYKYKDVLIWLQKQHSYSDDEKYRNSIERLLKRIGYSLCEFDEKYISDFDSSTSNVSSPATSVYAVVNPKGYVVCRGHVVFPM